MLSVCVHEAETLSLPLLHNKQINQIRKSCLFMNAKGNKYWPILRTRSQFSPIWCTRVCTIRSEADLCKSARFTGSSTDKMYTERLFSEPQSGDERTRGHFFMLVLLFDCLNSVARLWWNLSVRVYWRDKTEGKECVRAATLTSAQYWFHLLMYLQTEHRGLHLNMLSQHIDWTVFYS